MTSGRQASSSSSCKTYFLEPTLGEVIHTTRRERVRGEMLRKITLYLFYEFCKLRPSHLRRYLLWVPACSNLHGPPLRAHSKLPLLDPFRDPIYLLTCLVPTPPPPPSPTAYQLVTYLQTEVGILIALFQKALRTMALLYFRQIHIKG